MIFEDLLRNPLHLLMLFLVATMIFGTSKLADAGKNLGRGIKEFKKEMRADDETQPATPAAAVTTTVTTTTPVAALTGQACHSCGAALPTGARFCLECGTAVMVEAKATGCPTCHAALAPSARFCNECGTPVGLVPA